MNREVRLSEIVWPYRPDLLIRIDFLDWYEEVKERHFSGRPGALDARELLERGDFFEEAKAHPYFIHFVRKRRPAKLRLGRESLDRAYAERIASFIELLDRMRESGLDRTEPIELRRSLFLRAPDTGEKRPRRYFIADGCHRLACLVRNTWPDSLPFECFDLHWKLVHRPLNWCGKLRRFGVLDEGDQLEFDRIFRNEEKLDWGRIRAWSRRVRARCRALDLGSRFETELDA